MINRTVYAIYGVRLADGIDRALLDEELGYCLNNGQVGWTHLGAHDKHATYLITEWDTKEAGEEVYHSGEYPNADKFARDRWNDDLRAAADLVGGEIVQGPGWFTILSED
jgi:hypothetical protein